MRLLGSLDVRSRHLILMFAGVASLVCMVIAIAVGEGVSAWAESRNMYHRAALVERLSADLLSVLKDAETGQRGYLLTGKQRYLEPYERAVRELPQSLSLIEQHAHMPPELISAIRRLGESKLAELKETIDLRAAGRADEALAVVQTDRGKAIMDELRVRLGAISSQARLQAESASTHEQRRAQLTTLLANLLSSFAVVLVATAGAVVYRLGRNSEARLAAKVHERTQALEQSQADLRQCLEATTRALAEAERTSDSRARFLSSAGHDLRQPVQSMMLFTDLLQAAVKDAEGMAAQALHGLTEAVAAQKAILDSMLEVARLDADFECISPGPVALGPLLAGLGKEFAETAWHKGLRLRVCSTAQMGWADGAVLERLLRVFVANALRFTDSGGVLLGIRRVGDGRLAVQVVDTGHGIPVSEQDLVFDEFYQVRNPERDRRKGLGLGLAIARRLAALAGHRITLRSHEGHGSIFAVELEAWRPVRNQSEARESHAAPGEIGTRQL